jgi:hypothetical protein
MSESPKKPSFSAAFPASAAIIAEFREVFGADVERIYCEEGGRTVGQKPDLSRFKAVSLRDIVIRTNKKATHGR